MVKSVRLTAEEIIAETGILQITRQREYPGPILVDSVYICEPRGIEIIVVGVVGAQSQPYLPQIG
jgi:hypothetical protein